MFISHLVRSVMRIAHKSLSYLSWAVFYLFFCCCLFDIKNFKFFPQSWIDFSDRDFFSFTSSSSKSDFSMKIFSLSLHVIFTVYHINWMNDILHTRFDNDLSILRRIALCLLCYCYSIHSLKIFYINSVFAFFLNKKIMWRLTVKFTFWLLPNLKIFTFIKARISHEILFYFILFF